MIHDFTEIAAHVDWEIQQSASVRSIYDFSGPVGARNNIMISISSLLGVIFFIAFADHLHRKQFIAWSAFGFALIACMIQILQLGPYGVGTVLLALGCFLFNCGKYYSSGDVSYAEQIDNTTPTSSTGLKCG